MQTDKPECTDKTTHPQIYDTIPLYHSEVMLSQYLVFNLFRIFRPVRKKYNVSINEIVILSGMLLYNKFIGSSFSYSGVLRYIKYFNDRKMRWYIESLQNKGYIVLSDILNGNKRYKLTIEGIECMNYLNECYRISLDKFIKDNGIVV